MITEAQGKKIAAAARSWLGTEHINNARVKGVGVDCGQLLIAALEDSETIRKNEIAVKPYSNEWHMHRSEEWFKFYIEAYCKKISVQDIRPGDFLLYQYGRCCSHAGVYIGDNIICHAVVDQGVILTELDDVMFYDRHGNSRLRGVYRYNGGA